MPNAYNKAYNVFNGKYHVNLNLYNEYVNGKTLARIDDFASDIDPRAEEIDAYVSTLAIAFSVHMNNKIKLLCQPSTLLSPNFYPYQNPPKQFH